MKEPDREEPGGGALHCKRTGQARRTVRSINKGILLHSRCGGVIKRGTGGATPPTASIPAGKERYRIIASDLVKNVNV